MHNRLFFLTLFLLFLLSLGTFLVSSEPTLSLIGDFFLMGFLFLTSICAIQKFHYGTVGPMFLALAAAVLIFVVALGSSYVLSKRAAAEATIQAFRSASDACKNK